MGSRIYKRFPILSTVFCAVMTAAFQLAAATYSGRVVDAETGRGQGDVAISLQNATGQTTSDSTGAFSLTAFLGVRQGGPVSKAGPILRYLPRRNGFDMSLATQVQSIALYTVQGRCIAAVRHTPAEDVVPLNVIARGVYLLCMRTAQQTFTSVWNHTGFPQVIVPRAASAHARRLARAAADPALLFEKTGYQQKQVPVIPGRDYNKSWCRWRRKTLSKPCMLYKPNGRRTSTARNWLWESCRKRWH